MTLTLAVDTATDVASVALGANGALLAQVVVTGRRHAAAAVPATAQVLALAGADLADVSRIVVADGPGSFTGVRIGFATVQGILRARPGIAVFTAPSLLGAAWVAARFHESPVAALYDALRGEVFAAVYAFSPEGVRVILPPTLGTVHEIAARAGVQPVVAVGDGAARHAAEVRRWTGRAPIPPPAGAPRAAAYVALADTPGALQPVPDLTTYEPNYGRPAEAQARWERAHGRPLPHSPGESR